MKFVPFHLCHFPEKVEAHLTSSNPCVFFFFFLAAPGQLWHTGSSSPTRDRMKAPALGAWSPSHQTTREGPWWASTVGENIDIITSSLQTPKILRDKQISIQHTFYSFFFKLFFSEFAIIKYSRCCKPMFLSTMTIDFIKHRKLYILYITLRGLQINIHFKNHKIKFLYATTQNSLSSQAHPIHKNTHTEHTRHQGPNTRLLDTVITFPLTKESVADLPFSCFQINIWGRGMYFKKNAHYKVLPLSLSFISTYKL